MSIDASSQKIAATYKSVRAAYVRRRRASSGVDHACTYEKLGAPARRDSTRRATALTARRLTAIDKQCIRCAASLRSRPSPPQGRSSTRRATRPRRRRDEIQLTRRSASSGGAAPAAASIQKEDEDYSACTTVAAELRLRAAGDRRAAARQRGAATGEPRDRRTPAPLTRRRLGGGT